MKSKPYSHSDKVDARYPWRFTLCPKTHEGIETKALICEYKVQKFCPHLSLADFSSAPLYLYNNIL